MTTNHENWMGQLAQHYDWMYKKYPDDRLMLVFDIDGTILDMRYMILSLLQAYDAHNSTDFFTRLQIDDITVHEKQVQCLLVDLGIPVAEHQKILDWYGEHLWEREYVLTGNRPFPGVLEVIKWFKIQPNTFIGLNTGRPEGLRQDTLRSLNELSRSYHIQFQDEWLVMNPQGSNQEVAAAKAAGIRKYRNDGFRVVAYIDNEPEILEAMAQTFSDKEILLLHADTIFESSRSRLPPKSAKGKEYDLKELISDRKLPATIDFVWHGINGEVNLRQFLASDKVMWGECDVRLAPTDNKLILRHDSFAESKYDEDEEWLTLEQFLGRVQPTDKGVKFDLKTGGSLLKRMSDYLSDYQFPVDRLWFNGDIEHLLEDGFTLLAKTYEGAVVQAPVDFLTPLVCSAPKKAREILQMFESWGINRFSISRDTENMLRFFDQMGEWGYQTNIYNVPNLDAFLRAVLMFPCSITSDFNFPQWHYYGRGSGQNRRHFEYIPKPDA